MVNCQENKFETKPTKRIQSRVTTEPTANFIFHGKSAGSLPETISYEKSEEFFYDSQCTLLPGHPVRYAGTGLLKMMHIGNIPFVIA
jgi:hypothetical protein